jgi:hypothetical protein
MRIKRTFIVVAVMMRWLVSSASSHRFEGRTRDFSFTGYETTVRDNAGGV